MVRLNWFVFMLLASLLTAALSTTNCVKSTRVFILLDIALLERSGAIIYVLKFNKKLNMKAEMNERNNKPLEDFCGLSPNVMQNWFYAPMTELQGLTIETPTDFSHSPVMRYLELIINSAMENGGKFKATSKGNLPTFIVKQATELWPELPTSDYPTHISISEFAGVNEDKFNALHYTRILAEIAGIIFRRGGYFHVKKDAQKLF